MGEAGALKSLAGQFLRFGMVGGFVTVLGVAAYYVPATYMGVAPLLANMSDTVRPRWATSCTAGSAFEVTAAATSRRSAPAAS